MVSLVTTGHAWGTGRRNRWWLPLLGCAFLVSVGSFQGALRPSSALPGAWAWSMFM